MEAFIFGLSKRILTNLSQCHLLESRVIPSRIDSSSFLLVQQIPLPWNFGSVCGAFCGSQVSTASMSDNLMMAGISKKVDRSMGLANFKHEVEILKIRSHSRARGEFFSSHSSKCPDRSVGFGGKFGPA